MNTAGKATSKTTVKSTTVTLLLLVVAIGITAACQTGPPDSERQYSATRLSHILEQQWSENPVRYEHEMRGHKATVKGRVKYVRPNGTVTFRKGPFTFTRLHCRFPDRRDTLAISRGDKIYFTGHVAAVPNQRIGAHRGNIIHIHLEDCRLRDR